MVYSIGSNKKVIRLMKRVKMGDICLDPIRKRYFQKKIVRLGCH